jgi:hypothetical protein
MSKGGLKEICDPVVEVFELLHLQEVGLKQQNFTH